MLNLTASMAVAFRDLADDVAAGRFRPAGDLIYFAVADEESGSAHGARWMADHHLDAIRADYVLTENGGLHSGPEDAPFVGVNVAEKGVAWRKLTVRGTPGHGSMPFRSDNAFCSQKDTDNLPGQGPGPSKRKPARALGERGDPLDDLRFRFCAHPGQVAQFSVFGRTFQLG